MARRTALALTLAALATLAALWLDPVAYRLLSAPDIDRHDWARMLRVMGTLWFWWPLAAARWLESRSRGAAGGRGALRMALVPALAGLFGEALKLLIRRERPSLHLGSYFYRPFSDRLLDSHDLGFPSSHVVVAFAGATIVAREYRGAAPIAYLLAAGCAAVRVLSGAHFLSDVVGGALVGWAVALMAARRFPPIAVAD